MKQRTPEEKARRKLIGQFLRKLKELGCYRLGRWIREPDNGFLDGQPVYYLPGGGELHVYYDLEFGNTDVLTAVVVFKETWEAIRKHYETDRN